VEVVEEDDEPSKSTRSNARIEQMQAIMSMNEPPHITVERVCSDLSIDAQRATYLLWLLVKEGKLEKFGRGENAVWKVAIKMQNVVEFA
jgi:predicted HTH transcriptional regulator